jgi:hypothetical protein
MYNRKISLVSGWSPGVVGPTAPPPPRRYQLESVYRGANVKNAPYAGRFNKNVAVWLLGTRFESRNCISEPDSQKP